MPRRGQASLLPFPMSALFSPTPFLSSSTPHFLNPTPTPTPTLTPRFFLFPSRTARSFKISANSDPDNKSSAPPPPPPPLEKRSLGVATGEFFLGIAALFLKKNNASQDRISRFTKAFTEDVDVDGAESRFLRPRERIASVSEGVIWEQRLKDVEAEKSRKNVTSPGFSFSAAGLLMPYHLGAAQYLIEKGYIKESTPLAGSSAGAIVCAIIASGVSMQMGLQATKVLAEDCRLKGTAFRLGAVLKEVLGQFLPDDIHYKSNGRIRVTQLFWRPRALLVDQFDSREDLINALFTSSFIPGYLAPTPATLFRNRLCIDGGLTLFMPPTSASNTVRVCAFPASRLGLSGIGISPDCNPDNRATPRQLFNWAMEPAEDDVLDNLFELGYLDAAVWGDLNPVDEIVQDESVQDEAVQDESPTDKNH